MSHISNAGRGSMKRAVVEEWGEVAGFHLRRFLASWFHTHDVSKIWVTLGREGIPDSEFTIWITAQESGPFSDYPWEFEELSRVFRSGERESNVGTTGQLRCAVPIHDDDEILAFAVLPGFGVVDSAGIAQLNRIACDAIRTARRNAVRLFFDEADPYALKETVYGALERVPIWAGVKNSLLLLADTLATATHRDEMLYRVAAHVTDNPRLVGLVPETGDYDWFDAFIGAYHDPRVVPLKFSQWDGDRGLGALVFDAPPDADVVDELEEHLAQYLFSSPYFSIGLEKQQILKEVRTTVHSIVADRGEDSLEKIVRDTTKTIIDQTAIPSVSIGRVDGDQLVFDHALGWTEFDHVTLPISGSDPSVASLAVRLNRSLVLVGGEHGEFENHVWIHEGDRTIDDDRRPHATIDDQWKPLSSYYKPARANAYATLAYPITFADKTLGVLALELDADTPWFWWNGLASHTFWESLADEIAVGIYAVT